MHRSTDRFLTTHAGSLPRPGDLLELIQAKATGRPYDQEAFAARVRQAVGEIVRKQTQPGGDVGDDGEEGKPGLLPVRHQRRVRLPPRPAGPGAPWGRLARRAR